MCLLPAAGATTPSVAAACAGVFPLDAGKTKSDIVDYDGYLVTMKIDTLAVVEDIQAGPGTGQASANVCQRAGTAS